MIQEKRDFMFISKRTGTSLLARILIIVMILQLFLACPFAVQAKESGVQAEFYVSPGGSDANDGKSAASAFATLEKAKDAVRAANANMTGDIIVYLMDGTWELDHTLTFDERDSGTNGFTVRYQAAPGAKPIISGGKKLSSQWTVASDVNWLKNGLKAYKTNFVRNDKIRAIYVNDQRASLTRKSTRPKRSVGNYRITAGQADWAWISGSKPSGNVFDSSFLPANTRNPQNIELESGSTWVKAMVCAASLENIGNGETQVNFQMPYAAMAQNLNWNCAYSPTATNDVTNVFEWLSKEGEFYFDQAGSTLYYIPRAGEDMNTAEVIVPELDQLLDLRGSQPMNNYVENIAFDGIKFAYTDWNLYEVAGSHGNATHQAATVITKFSDGDWHNDIYRAYDVPTAAIQVNTAKNIKFLNGEISNTGYLGLHLENDVWNCDVTGNYIAQTGGSGLVIGHPQHVYENDTSAHRVGNGASCDKEKFPAGTESVPKHITITNNYLLENCYFFPGNSPITSFFTYDMKVLNNFVYKCSYSGLSIGWAWCEFDGTSSSKLPGKPTITSRKNTVSNNRIEEICSILQDAGGIYTLGQQGNEDWTEVTVMNDNFINAKRAPQQADGSRMVNGFHPDEGSAYITMDGNVVTNIIRNVYELNDWKRKHDVIVTNGFSNTDRSETTAPNCTVDMYVNADYTWPLRGYRTVLNSGLEDEYVYMVGKDVIGDTEYELASNVRMEAGMTLPRRGLLKAEDTVWIAPAGTKVFAEGPTMTKSAGNVKSIQLPAVSGTYKLYIQYANGTVSAPSEKTVYVGEAKGLTNVTDGMNYSISAKNPLKLSLNTDTYSFTLNGKPVSNGDTITVPGDWTLSYNVIGDNAKPEVIHFTTFISQANALLTKNIVVKPGEVVKLADNPGDPGWNLWLASMSASAFEESASMTRASGQAGEIAAPMEEGVYDLAVTDAEGKILSRSDCTVTVSSFILTVPVPGYIMDFAADQGITATAGHAVSSWTNAANEAQVLMQTDAGKMPKQNTNAYGMPYLTFDGAQLLTMNGVNLNNLSGLTVLIMSRNATTYDRATYNVGNGDRNSPLYVSETSDWSGLYVNPYQDWIGVRFGTSVSNCYIKTTRAASTSEVTVAGAVKNGTVEKIYDEGVMIYSKSGQAERTKNIGDRLSVGYSYSGGDTYFSGDIYEILIYDRALSDEEIASMTEYLRIKYEGPGKCKHAYEAVVTAPTCTSNGYTTHLCPKCGDRYVTDPVPALGHEYQDGVCVRCGAKDPSESNPCDGGKNCPSSIYTDAPAPLNWAHEGIDYCIRNHLMNGTSATQFSPNGTLTRGQLVTILYRMAQSPAVSFENRFTDVAKDQYYSDAVIWAANSGVVTGYPDQTFKPDAKITREQIATILYRYEQSPSVDGSLDAFPDQEHVSSYARDALIWATTMGLINGVKSGSVTNLAPKANTTRAQIAAIIMRYRES